MGKQIFNIKGMMRDLDPAKSPNQYAYEIRNLRLTAQEDTTMLALVSEKGNAQCQIIEDDDPVITEEDNSVLLGVIIGYCVLHNYLTIFTHDENDPKTPDRIYRLEMNGMTMTSLLLYRGDLGFGEDGVNIEALGVYENENLQRVYWVDGVHQSRSINIADRSLIAKWALMSVCPFDFMMEMRLKELTQISYSSNIFGVFPSGTIQYVLAYYSKNGQRTPAFHVSTLYYTSVNNRGGSPEESCSGAFEIKIVNSTVDSNFDYISIYSVQRTSINGTPICKKVVDLRIADFAGAQYVTYVDNGLSSETVDYSEILYLGGSNIVPYTMEQKQNTLFFGNIKYNDFIIEESDIEAIAEDSTLDFCVKDGVPLADSDTTFYPYTSQINWPASYITTFKFGESYYFGIIAQNKYGQWSNVVPLHEKVLSQGLLTYPRVQNPYPPYYNPSPSSKNYFQPIAARVTFGSTALALLNSLGCKKIKMVRMDEMPSIACQGVLCPTVFSKDRKESNGTNYAQSSWYFRPIRSGKNNEYIEDNKAQYYHNLNLRFVNDVNCNEIQGSSRHVLNYYNIPNQLDLTDMDMFVDWNILTFHSPDIEFGDVHTYDNKQCSLRIVGITPIEYGITSMFLDLDSPAHSPLGRFEPFTLSDISYNTNSAPVCLSNLYYIDNGCDSSNTWSNGLKEYVVFPWHRFSSLSSQLTPQTDDEWYGKLGSKCMATLRSSFRPLYEEDSLTNPANLVDVTDFRYSNSLNYSIQIPVDNNCSDRTRIYHGNVDKILSGTMGNYGKPLNSGSVEKLTEEESSIRMSYKSSTHGVLSLKYDSSGNQTILPNTTESRGRSNYYPINFLAKLIVGKIDDTNPNIASIGNSPLRKLIVNKAFANQMISSGEAGDLVIFRHPYGPYGGTYDGYDYDEYWFIMSDAEATAMTGYDSTNYPVENWYYLKSMYESSDKVIQYCMGDPVPDESVTNLNWYYIYMYIDTPNSYIGPTYSPIEDTILEIYKIGLRRQPSGGGGYTYDYIDDIIFVERVFYGSTTNELQGLDLPDTTGHQMDYLYLADLVLPNREPVATFAGTKWIVAGRAYDVSSSIIGNIGDTYFQRYDCLKTFPWSSDSQNQIVDIFSFICETRINIEGRYDIRRGMSDNTLNSDVNFNKVNMAYSSPDNFFAPQYVDLDTANVTHHPNQIIWSMSKVYGSKIDTWAHIVPTSTLDINGSLGEIRSLQLWNDNLICFQDTGIAKVMYNERTTISTQQGVPIEIANSGKVDGGQYISDLVGCSNKNSIRLTQEGIYFVDSNTKELYKLSKGLESLSKSKGFNAYFNDSRINMNSIKSFYDPGLKDVYFRITRGTGNTERTECLVYNEQLGEFTSFFDYDMDFMFQYKNALVSVEHNSSNLWKQFAGDEYLRYFDETYDDEPVYKEYSVELISAENPTATKIFTGMEFRADVLGSSITQSGSQLTESGSLLNLASINKLPFKTMRVWNEYQDTGNAVFQRLVRKGANLSQKFRIWRADIDRDHNEKLHHFNRITSPWARFRLRGGGEDIKTVIHDIGVMYV